ncbi:Sugar transport protein 7 [Zea mays]|uniref:Sugar transport protein 7 n=1 Tax=Zea mays TaxID=4577 RepID=A0A1D6I499_MAIZE|nr:Sugar transport protein 7 [Zea mays]
MAGGGVAALGVKTERAAQYKGRMTLAVATTCLVAAVGGAIFGYDIGISGPIIRLVVGSDSISAWPYSPPDNFRDRVV